MTLVNIPQKLPILFLQNHILLPGSSIRIPITGPRSMNMVKSRLLSRNSLANSIVGVVTLDSKGFEANMNNSDCKIVGTAAFVLQVGGSAWPKSNSYTLYMSGICRFLFDKLVMEEPYPVGVVTQLDYFPIGNDESLNSESEELANNIRDFVIRVLKTTETTDPDIHEFRKTIKHATLASLPDLVMSRLVTSYEVKKEILITLDIKERLKKMLFFLKKQLESLHLTKNSDVPKANVFVLTIPKEHNLQTRTKNGDQSDLPESANEMDELQNKIVKANLPTEVNKVVTRDLHRLKKMGPFSPEHSVIRNYIEFVVELPWAISSTETIDINKSRKDLDKEHYGMNKVKQRVLEYLAVRQLKSSVRGPILCFVGPPGVGKTSIGRSIAHTLGRQFQRISLGGVSNQSDIRGHRRTYIGAMPGRIIQAIKNAGVNNPVILLDEIDKMTSGVHGDPAAALLEVLDPLQNHHFLDHYLNVPFDLSQVTFIATANQVNTIPAPLLDRTETISVCGYTLEEKVYIAEHHLLPKQLKDNGLSETIMQVPMDSLKKLIGSYTSEAGVRNLERKLGALCRAVAVKVAESKSVDSPSNMTTVPFQITLEALEDILGPPVYTEVELWSRVGSPGVAVGLAYTSAGGSLTLVEASRLVGGEGKLILTGHLGNVMKESAHLALNWVRTISQQYGLVGEGEDLMNDIDVHIHFPAGAVGKEGPSAGITIAAALVSLFAGVPLIPGLALSGELTLRGVVLPVGGVREKLLAAHRAGLKKVILPKICIKDLYNVPQNVKDEMSFLFVSHMEEVIDAAFDGLLPSSAQPHSSSLQSRL